MSTTPTPSADLLVCPACGRRCERAARFCSWCGARLTVERGERKVVTVLFADLSGFTRFSEFVDPEAVRVLAESAARIFGGMVEQHGGHVDKIIGDCIMATFGANEAADDPARAVRAALEMLDYAAEHPAEFAGLSLSIGVNTGETMVAPVGPQGERTVLGDTVNVAAKLQSLADPGTVLVGAATLEAAGDAVEAEPGPPLPLTHSIAHTWRAVAIKGTRVYRAPRASFVGRVLELRRLAEVWERACTEGTSYLAVVSGASGIGKTRLVEEFRASIRIEHAVYVGRCLPYDARLPYWPVAEAIKTMAGILHDDPGEIVSKKLGAMLEQLMIDDLDQLRTIAVAVANLVAAPTTPRGTYSAERITRAELHWGIRRLFELHAATRPVLLVIEGLTWAEPALLELIGALVDGRLRAPVLVIATALPAVLDAHPELTDPKRNRRSIALGPLNEREATGLMGSLGVADERARQICARAGGNPLFLEEARWLTGPIPGDLNGVVAARVGMLDERSMRVAGTAAVMGRVFWSGALDAIAPEAVESTIEELERLDLIRRNRSIVLLHDREFEFRHALVQRELLRRFDPADRARAHAAIARWIAGLPDAERGFAELAAYHLEHAARGLDDPQQDLHTSALAAMRRAARRAEDREGAADADDWYRRALELAGHRAPETKLELTLERARRRAQLYDAEHAIGLLDDVIAEARRLERRDVLIGAMITLAMLTGSAGGEQTAELIRQLHELIGPDPSPERAEVLMIHAAQLLRAGHAADGLALLRESASIAHTHADDALRIRCWHHLGWGLLGEGALAEAEDAFAASAALARSQGSLAGEIAASWVSAEIAYYRGPRSRSAELARRTLGWLERIPDPFVEVRMCQRLGTIALAEGDHAEAERWMRTAYETARVLGGAVLVEAARHLAQVLLRQLRFRDAERIARLAAQHLPQHDHPAAAALGLLQAYLAAGRGDGEAARAGFIAGIEAMTTEPLARADTRVMFSRALQRLGHLPDAREQLRIALDTYAAYGADAMVAEVYGMMERLGREAG